MGDVTPKYDVFGSDGVDAMIRQIFIIVESNYTRRDKISEDIRGLTERIDALEDEWMNYSDLPPEE